MESRPKLAQDMKALLAELNIGYFNPNRGTVDPKACDKALAYGNFYGPWLP